MLPFTRVRYSCAQFTVLLAGHAPCTAFQGEGTDNPLALKLQLV